MTDLAHVRHHVELLNFARAEKARLSEIEDAAKAAIQDALGTDEIGTLDGATVVTWKRTKRTALSQTLLKKLHPDVYAECVDTTEVRTFRIAD